MIQHKSNQSDFGYNKSTGGESGFKGCTSKFKGEHRFNFDIELWNCATAYKKYGFGEPDTDPNLYCILYNNSPFLFTDISTSAEDIKYKTEDFIYFDSNKDLQMIISLIEAFLLLKWTNYNNFSKEYIKTDFFTCRDSLSKVTGNNTVVYDKGLYHFCEIQTN